MKFSKWFIPIALALGVMAPAASTLSAQEYPYYNGAYNRGVYRDIAHDQVRIERLRADIARDEARRAEAWRCGRYGEAQRISRDIARDRAELYYQVRDVRHDYRSTWR